MSGERPVAAPAAVPAGPSSALLPEERRWLHDKYERLSAEEGELSASRTSYFAALGTVLVTGLVVALADLMTNRAIFAVVVTFLGTLGILISVVWAILLHRTNDAQRLWREAARQLEQQSPPVLPPLPTPVQLRSGETLVLDLARPYLAHAQRFSRTGHISWMDRIDPSATVEILPITFLVIWSGVLIVAWSWLAGIL
ncbi:MAG: hypothetical protein WAK40_02620 [Thermoplasmata archaeon]